MGGTASLDSSAPLEIDRALTAWADGSAAFLGPFALKVERASTTLGVRMSSVGRSSMLEEGQVADIIVRDDDCSLVRDLREGSEAAGNDRSVAIISTAFGFREGTEITG